MTAGPRSGSLAYAPRPDWVGLDLVTIAGQGTERRRSRSSSTSSGTGGAQAISFGMNEDDVREVMRHDFVATASDGSTHAAGRRRSAPPARLRHVSAQDPLRARRQGAHARAGDPLVLGLAGRDPGAARPRRDPRRSVRRRRRLRPRATFRDAATFDQPTRMRPE